MSCLFFFFIILVCVVYKQKYQHSLSLSLALSLSHSFCELPGCKWYYIFNTTRHRASTNVDVGNGCCLRWLGGDGVGDDDGVFVCCPLRTTTLNADSQLRRQPVDASWRPPTLRLRNVYCACDMLPCCQVAMLPSCCLCHSSCCQLFAFSFIKTGTVRVCVCGLLQHCCNIVGEPVKAAGCLYL